MRRLTSIAVGFCMMVFAATASANVNPYEQNPCDDGCGGVNHDCECTVFDGCPCMELDIHGIVTGGLPVPTADEPQHYDGEYWAVLMIWIASLVE